MNTGTLIQVQEDYCRGILDATPYRDYRGTLLNRKAASLRGLRKRFKAGMADLGFNPDSESVRIMMKDAEDMAILEFRAD